MPKLSRRGFMVGCSSAIAAMTGARFTSIAFGDQANEPDQEVLVVVFLRGGADVLNLIPPLGGDDRGYYEAKRDALIVPTGQLLPLGNDPFGLHPSAAGLHELYGDNKLAIVQATGLTNGTRSHFDAMGFMESGLSDSFATSGWITRHLESSPILPSEIVMPALAMGQYTPQAFLDSSEVIAFNDPDRFSIDTGAWGWYDEQRTALRNLYTSNSTPMHLAGLQALNAMDVVSAELGGGYTPAPGVTYNEDDFAQHLKVVAQIIKSQLGLHAVTVDLGGWDTHESQGDAAGGYFGELVAQLSQGLHAFYRDLDHDGYSGRVTTVVMSEFGRRLGENADFGTDHGHGGAMMVLGGSVNGGQLFGTWPTLHPDALYEGIDLEVTTDYRQVLSELLIRRQANPNLGVVFPQYTNYAPLGVVQGVDLDPIYEVPTATTMRSVQVASETPIGQTLTAAGIGLAATAGLLALRERGTA